jgi:MFS family permease
VLGLASLASFIVILDVMVVATALTALRRHLGASLADLEWTVNAYTLSFAVLLLNAAFPPARRGWAIGIYGGVTALAAVAGPVLGGAVTQGLGPARLFRSPAFSAGNVAIFAVNAALTGVIFLMPQFQQVVAGQDPLGAGLRLLLPRCPPPRAHLTDRDR